MRRDPDAPPPFDPTRSGAEWWTQVIDSTHDAIGLHWDKDYALEHNDLNVHPHVGTVTYFANEGAPTSVRPRDDAGALRPAGDRAVRTEVRG